MKSVSCNKSSKKSGIDVSKQQQELMYSFFKSTKPASCSASVVQDPATTLDASNHLGRESIDLTDETAGTPLGGLIDLVSSAEDVCFNSGEMVGEVRPQVVVMLDSPEKVTTNNSSTIQHVQKKVKTGALVPSGKVLAPLFRMATKSSSSHDSRDKLKQPVVPVPVQLSPPFPSHKHAHVNYCAGENVSSHRRFPVKPSRVGDTGICGSNTVKKLIDITTDSHSTFPPQPDVIPTSSRMDSKVECFDTLPAFQSLQDKSQYDCDRLLCDKYRPRNSSEFLLHSQDYDKASMLIAWFKSFRMNRSHVKLKGSKKNKKRGSKDADLSSDFESDTTVDDSGDSDFANTPPARSRKRPVMRETFTQSSPSIFANDDLLLASDSTLFEHLPALVDSETNLPLAKAILLYSPQSTVKTSLASVVAREAGYQIIEINPSQKKDGMSLIHSINEAVQSHRLNRARSSSSSINRLFACPSRKGNETRSNTDKRMHTAILIDEVDLLFESEAGFWRALIPIIRESRRPIILTCNDLTALPPICLRAMDDRSGNGTTDALVEGCSIKFMGFRQLELDKVAAYLVAVAKCEGCQLSRMDAENISRRFHLKSALNQLQLMVSTRRTQRKNRKNELDGIVELVYSSPADLLDPKYLEFLQYRLDMIAVGMNEKESEPPNTVIVTSESLKLDNMRRGLGMFVDARILYCQTNDIFVEYFPHLRQIIQSHYAGENCIDRMTYSLGLGRPSTRNSAKLVEDEELTVVPYFYDVWMELYRNNCVTTGRRREICQIAVETEQRLLSPRKNDESCK